MRPVPETRIKNANKKSPNWEGDFVLYWMVANRRAEWNHSLQRAAHWANELKKPLVVFEALRCGYQWASDRIHHFVVQGMADNEQRLASKAVEYYPYLETSHGDGKGLIAALAKQACLVVSDDFPCFFLPRMLSTVADRIPVSMELVDGNGLFPMRATDRVFTRAYSFRRFLQKNLLPHLSRDEFPLRDSLAKLNLPRLSGQLDQIRKKWPAADLEKNLADHNYLGEFAIDHSVKPCGIPGGARAAQRLLREFVQNKLPDYDEKRNQPQIEVTSGLSPYLHFGHVSAHQVFAEAAKRDSWSVDQASEKATGSSSGWWNASPEVESFWDELITWRELGYNMCCHQDNYDQYESLPDWCQATLQLHARDHRPHIYELEQFESAQTHDPLWNAAQRQLVREGRIHNYLRMLWGKKILQWSASPEESLEVMIELNNKYALDGRNPNSYSGIFWVLGRYDRAWGPERPIFGKIRYMTSENTARKVRVKEYIQRYGADNAEQTKLFD